MVVWLNFAPLLQLYALGAICIIIGYAPARWLMAGDGGGDKLSSTPRSLYLAPLLGFTALLTAIFYLTQWLGMTQVGALEPKPGVPPGSAHLASLVATTKASNTLAIVRAAYQDPKASTWLADRTGVPAVALPFTVGGDPASKDLFSMYDDTIDLLLKARK